ncbi:hypothetical protein CLAIMM_09541 [Cladophialophora immunda]|nr:hypothetical protein CLAIMM_09541 [Cladophialophora immunda]
MSSFMSDTSPNQAAAPGDKTPPKATTLSPRRMSSGQLVPVESQLWPNHPKNKHLGSVNSGVDTNSVNIPATGITDTKTTTKDIVEMTDMEDPGPPSVPDPASLASPAKARPNHSPYPGAGPGGYPIDGSAWRHHPANRRYQFFQMEQMHHEEINRLEWCALTKTDDLDRILRIFSSWTPTSVYCITCLLALRVQGVG